MSNNVSGEIRFPVYTTEYIFPSLVTMLWSTTNCGFRRRKLERISVLQKYGINKLLRISRKIDRPHILKYICNKEIIVFMEKKNIKTRIYRFFLIELSIKKNLPLDIIKKIGDNYFYTIL
tara:strand:- start:1304 stop:1663 length:360 start_codon:yes stop_codon:yes gene_type:complete